jgi:hypothetical protein
MSTTNTPNHDQGISDELMHNEAQQSGQKPKRVRKARSEPTQQNGAPRPENAQGNVARANEGEADDVGEVADADSGIDEAASVGGDASSADTGEAAGGDEKPDSADAETDGKPNGKDETNPFDDPFGDVSGACDTAEGSWRVDLPTEEDVKNKATSTYGPEKLRALVKLRAVNLEEYADLTRKLADAAKQGSGVTRAKIDAAVQRTEKQLKQEARSGDDQNTDDDSVSVKILDWLKGLISAYFIDDYRRPFVDYRDPGTGVFTCRPVLHEDIKDLINTCPVVKVAPPDTIVSAVVRTLEAWARRSGEKRKVFVRRGWHDGILYIDRAAPDGSVIRVDASGYEVVPLDQCPVRFQHDIAMDKLPIPMSGGSISELWKVVRVKRKQDQDLVSGFIIGCYAPHGPFCGLAVYGQYGSAKSMLLELVASLVDPSKVSPGSMSESEENTVIHAQRVALLQYDNLTELSKEQSNTLCRIVQGNGFRTRLLYSNFGEVVMNAELSVLANGISQFVTSPDLVDRFTTVTLERIPKGGRKERRELRDAFALDRPKILGAFLNAISKGLARNDFTRPANLPRLADHAVWVSRCEFWLGMQEGGYIKAMEASAQTGARDAVDSDFLSAAVVRMQDQSGGAEWRDTPEATWNKLTQQVTEAVKRKREWPQNGSWLSRRLRPLVPPLAMLGIEVTLDTRIDTAAAGNRRGIIIKGRAAAPVYEDEETEGPTTSQNRSLIDVEDDVAARPRPATATAKAVPGARSQCGWCSRWRDGGTVLRH